MKILFDNQKFTTDSHGGIVRYFTELMRHYEKESDISYMMPIIYSNTEYLHHLARFSHVQSLRSYNDFLTGWNFRGKSQLYRLWCRFGVGRKNQELFSRAAKTGNYDLVHPTYYNAALLRQIGQKPFVLTIYDMIHELYLAKLGRLDPTVRSKKKLAKQATRIIAISHSTKTDIINMLGVPADKIDVIYLANSLSPSPSDLAKRPDHAPLRYILFVGNRGHYKNFSLFAQAIAPLLREQTDLHLVCVGGGAFGETEKNFFRQENIIEKCHQRRADDIELARYYAHAVAFVFPSLYEGFGIPILESFACGCPAILSNTSSLPEVGGDAAVYFDPHNKNSIYQVVKDVLSSSEKRQAMIEAGYKQLEKFSWQKTAVETIATYKRALRDMKS